MLVSEQPFMNQEVPLNLTSINPNHLSAVMVELTNRCNLRCAFCSTGHPKYKSGDMPTSDLNRIIQFCTAGGIKNISISGHGETTIADGWEDVARTLIDNGFQLSIISNLAKSFSESQAQLLSRFAFIMTSIDSMDPDMLKNLRCKVDLRNILCNLQMIRIHALSQNRKPPNFGITSVVFYENFHDLDKIIGLAASIKGSSVYVNSPIEFEGLDNKIALTHPMKLRGRELQEMIEYFGKVIRLARSLGVSIKIDESLVDFLTTAKQTGVDSSPYKSFRVPLNPGQTDEIMMRYWSRLPGPGQTRLCLDPWNLLLFERHGSILSCCIGLPEIAQLATVNNLHEIINSPKARQLRTSLLTGQLPMHCKCCARKPLVNTSQFQQIVSDYYNSKSHLKIN